MGNGYIQTVLGPVDPASLGLTLIHEHVLLDLTKGIADAGEYETRSKKYVPIMRRHEAGWEPGEQGPGTAASWNAKWNQPVDLENLADRQRYWVYYGDQRLDSIDDAIWEFDQFKRAGGGAIVDQTTPGMGRDPRGLAEVSRATGVHLIMSTGWYIHDFHPPDMGEMSEDQAYERIMRDIEKGISGGFKAGMIGEVGIGWPIHPDEEKVVRASARASAETGVPLSIHPGPVGESIWAVIEIIENAGGDLSKTIISHCDSRMNTSKGTNVFEADEHLKLAKTGVYMSYDTFGWEGSYRQRSPVDQPNDAIRLNWLKIVADAGHERQVMVSSDIALKHWLRRYGGHGWRHHPESIVDLMRYKGFSDELVNMIYVENPRRALTRR